MKNDKVEKSANVPVPVKIKAICGGVAGMIASAAAHPFDLIKVRLQLLCKDCTSYEMTREIVVNDGFRALYSGVSAALFRQATYTTARLGVYSYLYDSYKEQYHQDPTVTAKVGIGICSGMVGAFAGTPSEVVLVRMMADGPHYPCYCQRKYKGIIHALTRICNEEGFRSLWRGGVPTLVRSILVSTAQLGTYTQARETMLRYNMKDDIKMHTYASIIASFATAVVSLPADNIKTRTQHIKEKVSHIRILRDVIRDEGVVDLWKGFWPYFQRLSIHTVLTFVIFEESMKYYKDYVKSLN